MAGTVTISIEVELGWGKHDLQEYDHLSSDGTKELDALSSLLSICDECQIPISFDIVGHLLQENCAGHHRGPHPESWWEADPGTDWKQDPLFYAPHFVKRILNSKTNHEICTHTYSHVLCDEISDNVLDYELTKVNDLHAAHGLKKPRSIVTPRHQNPSPEVLENHGINTLRVPVQRPSKEIRGIKKIDTFASHLIVQNPVKELEKSGNLIKTFCTRAPSLTSPTLPSGQSTPHPAYRAIPPYLRQALHHRLIRATIGEAISKGQHTHLWTHLYNMSNQSQMSIVRSAIKYIAGQRDDGKINIVRMCDLPEVASHD